MWAHINDILSTENRTAAVQWSWRSTVPAQVLAHLHNGLRPHRRVSIPFFPPLRKGNPRFGELDLVAQNRTYLCFVEVKLRRSAAFGTAAEFVDPRKQKRLRTTAQLYLQQNPTQLQPRFDVIEVLAPQGMDTRAPKIRHLADAF